MTSKEELQDTQKILQILWTLRNWVLDLQEGRYVTAEARLDELRGYAEDYLDFREEHNLPALIDLLCTVEMELEDES